MSEVAHYIVRTTKSYSSEQYGYTVSENILFYADADDVEDARDDFDHLVYVSAGCGPVGASIDLRIPMSHLEIVETIEKENKS